MLIGSNYLHTWCVDSHPKKCFFVIYGHPAVSSCVQSATFWSGQPCQSFVWLTGPKRGQSSAFWSGQQTRQIPVSLCLVYRTKTSRFDHNSTLHGVHIEQKNTF
ncbi:hypothetical protein Hanom_Chr08g00708071 [Helianthus anomalus]